MRNILTVDFNEVSGYYKTTLNDTLFQYDKGQELHVKGINLSDVLSIELHYQVGENVVVSSAVLNGTSIISTVPDEFFESYGRKSIYIYLKDDGSKETEYVIECNVEQRPKPDGYVPTPEESDQLNLKYQDEMLYLRKGESVLSDVKIGEGAKVVDDYDKLENKPKINDVELDGDKTAEDLGLMSKVQIENKLSECLTTSKNYTDDNVGNIETLLKTV